MPAADKLGLSFIEETAYGHLRPDELAKWRYEGWPNICPACGKEIQNLEKLGWVVKRKDGDPRLVHLACLPGPTKEERQLADEFQGRSFPEMTTVTIEKLLSVLLSVLPSSILP